MRPSSFHIEFVHTGSSFFNSSLNTKNNPVVSQWMRFSVGSIVVVLFVGSVQAC